MQVMSSKQVDFCKHYVLTRNACQAALAAGFSGTYASKKAYQLLLRQDIQEEIGKLEKEYMTQSFKTLSVQSIKELESIIISGEDRDKLRAIEIVFKLNGMTKGLSVEAHSNDTTITVRLPDGL